MRQLLGWGFTSTQHRERAAELKERAALLQWDPRQGVLAVAQDHELAAQILDGEVKP